MKKSESRSASNVDGDEEDGDEDKEGVDVEWEGEPVPFVLMSGIGDALVVGVEGIEDVSKVDPGPGDVGVNESSKSKACFTVAFGVAMPLELELAPFPLKDAAPKSSSNESSKDVEAAAKFSVPSPNASIAFWDIPFV